MSRDGDCTRKGTSKMANIGEGCVYAEDNRRDDDATRSDYSMGFLAGHSGAMGVGGERPGAIDHKAITGNVIVIHVSGGCVQDVYANDGSAVCIVYDEDIQEDGNDAAVFAIAPSSMAELMSEGIASVLAAVDAWEEED